MTRRCASYGGLAAAVTVAWTFGWWLVVIGLVSSACSVFLIDRDNQRRLARHACALARHVPSDTCAPSDAETVVVRGIVAIAADDVTIIQIARRRVEAIFDPWRRSLAIERLDAAARAQVPPARRPAAIAVAVVVLVAMSATAPNLSPQLFTVLAACLTLAVAQITRRKATHSLSDAVAIAAAVDPLGEHRWISERAVIDVIRDAAHHRADVLRRAQRDLTPVGQIRERDRASRRLAAAAALATDDPEPRMPALLAAGIVALTLIVIIELVG